MRLTTTIAGAMLLAAACGDDDGSTGAGGSTSTSTAGPTTSTSGGPTTTSTSSPSSSSSSGQGGMGGSYEGVDPIAGIADVELVQGGFEFTEGTVWLPALGVLRFSDIPASTIHELNPANDMISVWRNPSGNTNGNALAPNGDIVMCEHSGRRVSRSPAGAPAPVLVAGEYDGMTLNSPNDAIVRSDGQVYFTDPTYGLEGAPQDIPWQGVYRVTTQGEVILVGDEYGQPNGISLSPDETKLYVSDSQDGGLFVYDVAADGSTGARSQLIDIGGSDGMAVDDAGNLYLTTGAGVEVFRDDGTPWGVIDVPEQPANCTFGGADRKTLFITARTGLYRVTLNVPGLP